MRTKIAYVLVSASTDYYLEQALISLTSVRQHNPQAHIVLVTDAGTAETFKETALRKQFAESFDEVKAIDVPEHKTNVLKSRYLKTNLRKLIDGDYLFIDTDTLICRPLDEIDNTDADIAMVLDAHVPIGDLQPKEQQSLRHRFGIDIVNQDYYNSGVIYCRDTPLAHKMYDLWHKDWAAHIKKSHTDQPPLYRTLTLNAIPVHELSGIWNCQTSQNGLRYLNRAKIIHFFESSGQKIHKLSLNSTYQAIRDAGRLTDEIMEYILTPKDSFIPLVFIQPQRGALATPFSMLYNHYKDRPGILTLLRTLNKILTKFG